ncbi:unnamed protein product [Spirodela intermedia]|uniref:Uncharacterized protein n=1 Tax=Spirodela intermedia TaxID=51605 RepID=A0A7I8KF27_SPIIN|nr:unnamed protein product [Spirodela intermedia]
MGEKKNLFNSLLSRADVTNRRSLFLVNQIICNQKYIISRVNCGL